MALSEDIKIKLLQGIKQMEAEGRSQNEIQQLVNATKAKYEVSEAQSIQQIETQPTQQQPDASLTQRVSGGVGTLVKGQRLITDPVETARQPAATAQTGLHLAQLAGQIGFPIASGLTTTPLTEFGIQKLKGVETPEAAQQAAVAGGLDLLLTGAGAGISKAAKPLLKKIIPVATGIPEEAVEIALKKPSIFKGKLNVEKKFNELGTKAQDAANYIKKQAGEAVGAEVQALKGSKIRFTAEDIAKEIDNAVLQKQFGRESILHMEDLKKIKEFSNKIRRLSKGNGMDAGELYAVRKQLDNLLTFDINKVKKTTSEGDAILKQARDLINQRLSDISPKFKQVSKKYAEVAKLQKEILPKLKDVYAGTNVKNIFKRGLATDDPVSFLNEFKQLDELVPKKLKFANEASETLVRQQFEQLTPKSSTLRNLRLASFGLGGYGAGAGRGTVLAGGAALAAGTTPRVYKKAIQTGSLLKKAIKPPLVKGVIKQATTKTATKPTTRLIQSLLLRGDK